MRAVSILGNELWLCSSVSKAKSSGRMASAEDSAVLEGTIAFPFGIVSDCALEAEQVLGTSSFGKVTCPDLVSSASGVEEDVLFPYI